MTPIFDRIRTGQNFVFQARKDGILVKPAKIIVEDLTRKPAWKKALERSLAEVKAGKGKFFASTEEFLADLEKESRKADRKRARKG